MGTLSALTVNLLIVVVFVAVVVVGLRIAQSIFGTSSKKAAATEIAAKLVSYPTGSAAVLRRRFVRAITAQHVIMPSGERLAFAELIVRVAPEDLERLDPDGDLERLGEDGATLYRAHAERSGWAVPATVSVVVEVDPGLRSGWVPPARGSGRAEPARRPAEAAGIGWDVVTDEPVLDATMNVAGVLRLERDGRSAAIGPNGAVLGRLTDSPLAFAEPEVSHRHAAIRRQGAIWQVKDLGSTNGTTVDGRRIDGADWVTLHAGAVLELAGVAVTAGLDTAGTVHLRSVTSR